MTERKPLIRRRIMREFAIKELSAVDRPAQGHALAVLMKRADDDSLDKDFSADQVGSGLLNNAGDEPMNDVEKKQLEDLQKSVAKLTEGHDALKAENAKLTEGQKALKAENTVLSDKLAKAEAKAAMSDDEKEYEDKLEDEEKKASFRAMSVDERKRVMQKAADSNPVIYKSERTGEEFRKNDDPRIVKYAKQADEDAAVAKAERVKREDAELAKRAEEAPYSGFTVDKSQDSGKEVSKLDVIRAISKMDDGPRAVLEKWLTIGAKAVSAAFNTIGHAHELTRKSAADFEKRVNEVQARDKISRLAALEKAQREFPEEFKAYQDSGARAN